MRPHRLRYCSRLPVSAEQAFSWHARPDAFERLAPPWQRIDVVNQEGTIREGDTIEIHIWLGPVPIRWNIVHGEFIENRMFTDQQLSGPFRYWKHNHRFHPGGTNSCILEDDIHYIFPLDTISYPVFGGMLKRDLRRLFRYRHQKTREELIDKPVLR